jgi:RNA ligase
MRFPVIEHLDEVLPEVEGRSDFVVRRGAGWTAIDYTFSTPDTFASPIRRECRGIKFGSDGQIIARPFHKFFNIGEKLETQPHLIDVSRPHVVMDKLDGSMVHPAEVDGQIIFMTRMGATDVAAKAQAFAVATVPELMNWCSQMLRDGLTPIFEFTSPGNRIVIPYPVESLTLLAIRDTRTGVYQSLDDGDWPIPLVPHGENVTDLADFMATTRALRNAEGYVIRFDDGLMLKIKAEDYVLRHKAKDGIGLEKNALRAVLEEADDDMIAVLPAEDGEALAKYAASVRAAIAALVERVQGVVAGAGAVDRKTFAVEHAARLSPMLRAAAFVGALVT